MSRRAGAETEGQETQQKEAEAMKLLKMVAGLYGLARARKESKKAFRKRVKAARDVVNQD